MSACDGCEDPWRADQKRFVPLTLFSGDERMAPSPPDALTAVGRLCYHGAMKIETPILKRLGPVPFWRGTGRCLDELERIYKKAITAARNRNAPSPL